MTKIYLVGSFLGVASLLSAQSTVQHDAQAASLLSKNTVRTHSKSTTAKGDDPITVYWSEDFSNGFDGQGDNGAWTVSGDQGNLWFHAFPLGSANGYDPDAPLTGDAYAVYGDTIPNFYAGPTIPSETQDNGFMMLDADRYNSTATMPSQTGVGAATSNPIYAVLESPAFDLTGIDFALLSFHQDWRFCCNNYAWNVEFSVDDGDTWVPYDVFDLFGGEGNVQITGEAGINISDVLQGATSLTDCRIRFIWDPNLEGAMSQYFLQLDDVAIVSIPENDIAIGDNWYNSYFESPDEEPDVDYVSKFEFWNQPNYNTRPFNFAAEVTNNGTNVQTGVQLEVTFQPPGDVEPQIILSDPIELESGASDTLRIYDEIPTAWIDPADGVYTMDFRVIQSEMDARPNDNIGTTKTTRVSSDASSSAGAIMQNDRNAFTNFYATLGQDVIWGNRMTFIEQDQETVITHVEFVLSGANEAPSFPGEPVHVNVRTGSVLSEEDVDNEIFRYFGDEEVEYVIEESDLTTNNEIWISLELPVPVVVEADKIYQAEMQVPAAGDNVAIIAHSNLQEPGAGVLYEFADPSGGPQGWWTIGDAAPLLRFRLTQALDVESVTYESGIKLIQNYPNPVVDNTLIQYQLDETSQASFEVMDMTGKLVYQKDLGMVPAGLANRFEFSASDLAPGVYTYSIVTENDRVTRKMMVE